MTEKTIQFGSKFIPQLEEFIGMPFVLSGEAHTARKLSGGDKWASHTFVSSDKVLLKVSKTTTARLVLFENTAEYHKLAKSMK